MNPGLPTEARASAWAKRSAADYVGKYATTKANLVKVMKRRARRKWPDMEDAQADDLARRTADFFEENLLVDDAAFAETKTRSGVRKGHSKRRIAMSLAAKGVAPDTIEEALTQADDLAAALSFARRRRIGPYRREEKDREGLVKESGAFARGGFSGDVARAVMRMTPDEAEEALIPPASGATSP